MIAASTLYGLTGSVVVGIGLWGLVARSHLLRRVLGFNVVGSGIFLVFGAAAFRRPDLGSDPVPQALIITGIVVALAATALVVALVVRHAGLGGGTTLPEDAPGEP